MRNWLVGVGAKPLVNRYVHRAVVAFKVGVVELVEVVARSWPLEAVVAQPCTDGAINNATLHCVVMRGRPGRAHAEACRDYVSVPVTRV